MRLVLDQGGYAFRNIGDWAMLRVTLDRLRAIWPDAEIALIAKDAQWARRCIEGVEVLTTRGRVMAACLDVSKRRFGQGIGRVKHHMLHRSPKLMWPVTTWWRRMRGGQEQALGEMAAYIHAVRSADLVVASGGGYLTDAFPEMITGVCSTFATAQALGKPTAMFGQGLGPLQCHAHRKRVAPVLRRLAVLALREARTGPALLDSLNVPPSHMRITGDDAIELAYQRRRDVLGDGIGINVRVAKYADLPAESAAALRDTFRELADRLDAALVPTPISLPARNNDGHVINQLLDGTPWADSAPVDIEQCGPENVIDAVARCRVVITGSYHAGVFALAQGIPVVGLAKSGYYIDKFLGLQDQFGEGCEVVLLDDPQAQTQIQHHATALWHRAADLRDPLLRAAERQIAASREAYDTLATSMAAA